MGWAAVGGGGRQAGGGGCPFPPASRAPLKTPASDAAPIMTTARRRAVIDAGPLEVRRAHPAMGHVQPLLPPPHCPMPVSALTLCYAIVRNAHNGGAATMAALALPERSTHACVGSGLHAPAPCAAKVNLGLSEKKRPTSKSTAGS